MPKSIKVSDAVYQQLLKLQRPRETFSEIVERLLTVYRGLAGLSDVIGGVKAFGEYQDEQRWKAAQAH